MVLVIIVGIVFAFVFKDTKKETVEEVGGALENEENILPTVDTSVKVELSVEGGKEAVLNLSGIPKGTESIDYELSYEEKTKGLQGVIGVITLDNEDSYEKKVTLGTCSSGKCVYHEVMGKIKLTLKFSGSYGDKIFEKEYDI